MFGKKQKRELVSLCGRQFIFMDLDLYKLQQKSPAFKSFAANGYQWFSVAKLTCLVEFINN